MHKMRIRTCCRAIFIFNSFEMIDLDLLVRWLETIRTYSPKWWRKMVILMVESLNNHQLNKSKQIAIGIFHHLPASGDHFFVEGRMKWTLKDESPWPGCIWWWSCETLPGAKDAFNLSSTNFMWIILKTTLSRPSLESVQLPVKSGWSSFPLSNKILTYYW